MAQQLVPAAQQDPPQQFSSLPHVPPSMEQARATHP
jgi:hypothetical protein